MINHCADKNERAIISGVSHSLAAKLSDDDWKFFECKNVGELTATYSSNDGIDVAIIDIIEKSSLSCAEAFRRNNEAAGIMLIADLSISPVEYMRPTIMAGSLLLHPVTADSAHSAIGSLLKCFLDKKQDSHGDNTFEVNSKEGREYIPYGKILYFEAREKKVFLITDNREIGFYTTIDELEKSLPDSFVRCHRSFIVNKSRIDKIVFAQNMLYLEGGAILPLSRSYKPFFK